MATFDPRVYHQMHAAAMHHQSVMNAGRYAAASNMPAQTSVHGGSSTALSPIGGGPGPALHHSRAPVGIPGAISVDSNGSGKNPRASASTSLSGRGNPGSPFLRAGPGWPSTYRAAQNIAFPEPREACGARVAEIVEDLAQGVGCPVEQILVPLLPCIGGLMGTNTSIQVHRAWSEPPVVWTMVGAAPGSRRSAVIRLLLAPILTLQAEKTAQRQQNDTDREPSQPQTENGSCAKSTNARGVNSSYRPAEVNGSRFGSSGRALYSGTRISLGALTEVLHRNSGHAFSLTENVEHLHEMLGLTQLPGVGPVSCPPSRLVSVMEDLYEGLPLVAVEDGRVTTIQGSNFCHGGFSSPEYMVALMLKYPGWLSSRLLISCPQADNMKTGFGQTKNNLDPPELEELFSILLKQHSHKNMKYKFSSEAVQELNAFFDEEWSTVFNQLDQNEHEGIIVKSMGQIVRLCGILKALDNSIITARATKKGEDNEWDWIIGPETVKNGVSLGKYFLEQKLAMTFMVSTGFFNQPENSQSSSVNGKNGNGSSDCDDIENMNNATTLPHTASSENIENYTFPPSQASGDGDRQSAHAPTPSHFPSFSLPPSGMHRSANRGQEPNLSQVPYGSPMPAEAPFGLQKAMGDVDFSTLPVTMTTAEEDVSEMMQAVDFVHFSKTQFVGVHGRRIKRLMECYDDGHGVSATTAAQKSITPPVHIEGTNNRHPAWASALFFQKVAELGLGSAEQNRHPTNKKVCWRFKRKPVNQLSEQDFKLLQYLRVEMDKYSQFGSGPFNPSDMVNSGLLTVPPSTSPGPQPLQLAALTASSSNSLTESIDDSSSDSQPKDRFGVNIKSEIY
ncbi:hypothetical protein ElyMa_004217400 [Elysia marginata]|uniref:K Homology domain-containing protein n=1 Tax=Elysia marginata TaxID=1093978 RepID=A0AAV4GNP8_9GAST|nr:hypothetical protein ElyMa_004217400 [Elysia marginata]